MFGGFLEKLVGDAAQSAEPEKTVQGEIGEKIWVRKEEEDFSTLWESYNIASVSADKKIVHIADEVNKRVWKVNATDTLHYDYSHDLDIDDLTRVNYLHEASLLSALEKRYMNDEIYTFFGDTLISINPYYNLSGLYDSDVSTDKPHVFSVARKAYETLKKKKRSQSIVINGDSGAGKTEAAKQIMRHFVSMSKESSNATTPKIENLVLSSTPVVEAFGNSVTLRNDNSSRFGRFVQIMYSDDGNAITGMNTLHFLLEKSRLIHRSPGERNYHIFYQCCSALESKGFKSAEYYNYLNPVLDSSNYQGLIPDDSEGFKRTCSALRNIGITDKVQGDIWKLLLAILNLGNIIFVDDDNDRANTGKCKISESSLINLEFVAENLNIENAKDLEKVLISHTIQAGGSNEKTQIDLNIAQASDSRDALAKFLYSAIFDWVIGELNRQSANINGQSKKGGKKKQRFIGILDIFGFEDLEKNSFEQVCVNYANELLQKQFDYYVIESEQKLFKEEGIQFPDIVLPSIANSEMVLSLLTQHVFKLLEEQCLLRTGSDRGFLSQLEKARLKNDKFSMDWKNQNGFIVKHFAGEVSYDAEGFVAKNSDSLYPGLKSLIEKSSSDLLRSQISPNGPDNSRKMASNSTVLKKFQKDMNALISTLTKTDQSFIRCIKPNSDQASHEWDVNLCLSQLNYLGIMQAIRVHQDTYPIRRSFEFIATKYHPVLKENKIVHTPKVNDLEVCRAIMIETLGKESEMKEWQCGYTKIFLGNAVLYKLDSIVNEGRLKELAAMSEADRNKKLEEERLKQEREIAAAKARFEREKAEAEAARKRKLEEERLERLKKEEEERIEKLRQEEEAHRERLRQEEEARKEKLRQEEEAQREKLRLEEEAQREKLRLEEERLNQLKREEEERLEKLRQEEEARLEKLRLEDEARKEKLRQQEEAQLERTRQENERLEQEQLKLQEAAARLEKLEKERLEQLQEEKEKRQAEEIKRKQELEAEQEKLKTEHENKLMMLKAEAESLKQDQERFKQQEEASKLKQEKAKAKALKEKKRQERKAANTLIKKKNAEKLARRKKKIDAVTKWQAMLRGAIIRYRYRDMINRRKMFKETLEPNELVVLASLVTYTNMARPKKHWLIFTTLNRILLTDPISMKIQEEIKFDRKFCKVTAAGKSERDITIITKHKGKVKTLKFRDLLNKSTTWVACSALDFSTEDYIKIGFERLLKGKVKRSAIVVPLKVGHLTYSVIANQSAPSPGDNEPHLFILIKKAGACRLIWYEKDRDTSEKGRIPVNRKVKAIVSTESSVGGFLNVDTFILEVTKDMAKKRYRIQAKSKESVAEWLRVLRYYIEEDKRKRPPLEKMPTMKPLKRPKSKLDLDVNEIFKAFEDTDKTTLQNLKSNNR